MPVKLKTFTADGNLSSRDVIRSGKLREKGIVNNLLFSFAVVG